MRHRALAPLILFSVCAVVYLAVLGERALSPSPNNHFVHLADGWLHGQLSILGDRPPGNNDWALYEGRWFVSFPPFPAVLLTPFVAIWGTAVLDRLIWALVAAAGPALLFVLLRALRQRDDVNRSLRDVWLLSGLFAFGTVFFFVAVQGSVWFAAHVVATSLLVLYVLFGLEARRPVLAGLVLGLCFMTRASTAFACVFFALEICRAHRRENAPALDLDAWPPRLALRYLAGVDWPRALRAAGLFAAPILVIGALAMWHNHARFDDPFVFGHEHLQVGWRTRIERWGLFNYHYLPKNLAIFWASLPWLSAQAPHVTVSAHGLALWFTTPNLLWTLWPRRIDARLVSLYAAVIVVGLIDLAYQNSGWVQFGYRFSLDYMPFLFVALLLGGRRFGPGFHLLAAFAVAVNLFGAITFDRAWEYYDVERSQTRIFQPD